MKSLDQPITADLVISIPSWIDGVDDDCARAMLESFHAGLALARAKGAYEEPQGRSYLAQALQQVPGAERALSAGEDDWDAICDDIRRAHRLLSQAVSCAKRAGVTLPGVSPAPSRSPPPWRSSGSAC